MLSLRSLIPATGESLGITVIVLDAVFLTLAAIAICFRLWARKLNRLSLCFNDYAIIAAWVGPYQSSQFETNTPKAIHSWSCCYSSHG